MTEEAFNDSFPNKCLTKSHVCFLACTELQDGKVFTDQTGRYPITPSSDNRSVFILYNYDTNFIFAEPLANSSAEQIKIAYSKIYNILTKAGQTPKLAHLDNECPKILKDFFADKTLQHKIVAPHNKRTNAAERAI